MKIIKMVCILTLKVSNSSPRPLKSLLEASPKTYKNLNIQNRRLNIANFMKIKMLQMKTLKFMKQIKIRSVHNTDSPNYLDKPEL